jgi:UPF0271 protein
MQSVDLNCDLGEGSPGEAQLMPLVTSANIACGGHAGDESSMRASVRLALQHGVALGAHPGFADRLNFGRCEYPVTAEEVRRLILTQTRALEEMACEQRASLQHVKLHGALYNQAARDLVLAGAVVEAMKELGGGLVLFAPAGSILLSTARERGLRTASEVFADRTYQADGSLTSRSRPDALITNEQVAVAQVQRMVREGKVRSTDGTDVTVQADTICVHGDGDHAIALVRAIRQEFTLTGVNLRGLQS